MTKDVLISISGVQLLEGDTNDVELITAGDYYNKNGKHYIRYEEIQEGVEDVIPVSYTHLYIVYKKIEKYNRITGE